MRERRRSTMSAAPDRSRTWSDCPTAGSTSCCVAWRNSACSERKPAPTPCCTAKRASSPLPEIMSDEDLVNALSQYLSLEPIEKQALLELAGPVERAAALLELI